MLVLNDIPPPLKASDTTLSLSSKEDDNDTSLDAVECLKANHAILHSEMSVIPSIVLCEDTSSHSLLEKDTGAKNGDSVNSSLLCGTLDNLDDITCPSSVCSTSSSSSSSPDCDDALSPLVKEEIQQTKITAFNKFRFQYLLVHTAIMFADGLQGTHLYVLYEGYGFSVATLYSLGFVSGAITSPFIGPLVDKMGRKKAAILYCLLEILINAMEQYPWFLGLLISRAIGGITTNLLFSVFESWLVTEHRRRKFEEDKLEIILRDSAIICNSAAIISGYLAHCLALKFGPVGPFEGAVAFTTFALLLVGTMWSENYGSDSENLTSFRDHLVGAYTTIMGDSKISRIGIIQGLTTGSLQTFVFLWSPALRKFSLYASPDTLGLDSNGEPAYGLIFGSFMLFGVIGGFVGPWLRKCLMQVMPFERNMTNTSEGECDANSVNLLCSICYFMSGILFLTPWLLQEDGSHSFTISLGAFMLYEFFVGVHIPCEGIVRSLYMPNESICSLMTMLRIVVNVAVAIGVISTNYISCESACGAIAVMMVVAAIMQLTLIPKDVLFSKSLKSKSD